MRQVDAAKSYATQDNAMKELKRGLAIVGRTMADTRWVIVAQPNGRYTPAVLPNGDRDAGLLMGLIHCANIAILG